MSRPFILSKIFSVPSFLEMSAVCVEITPVGVYYLTHKKTFNGFIPDKYGLIPLAPGEVVHSDIVNKESVIKSLELIKKKTGKTFVKYSIPEEKTYIFKTELPNLKPEEIESVLDFKLEENIPLSSKEAVFDYDLVPKHGMGGGMNVVVSATSAKLIEEMGEIFKAAGLIPLVFSPESNNLAKALINPKNEQVVIIVNIRESSIVMSLVVAGVVYQTSSTNFGSSTINDLLAKYYKTTPLEAGKIKKDKLFSDHQDNLEVFSYLINSLSALKDEIYKFITFCNAREDLPGQVERIILSGSDAVMYNLSNYLESNLGLSVEVANVWTNNFKITNYIPKINKVDSLNYAVVNGLDFN